MASLPGAVSSARIKSDYGEELKDFAEWYFEIFPRLVASGDAHLSLFKKADPPQYFEFEDKIKYVEHMEPEVNKKVVFTFMQFRAISRLCQGPCTFGTRAQTTATLVQFFLAPARLYEPQSLDIVEISAI